MKLQVDTIALLALISFQAATAAPVEPSNGNAAPLDADAEDDAAVGAYANYGDYGEYGSFETYAPPPGGYGDYPPSSNKRGETVPAKGTDYAAYTAYAPPGGYKNYPEYANYGKYDRDLIPKDGTIVPPPWGYQKLPEEHDPGVVRKRNDAVPAKGTDYAAYIAYAPPGGYKNYPEYANYGEYDRDISPDGGTMVSSWEFEKSSEEHARDVVDKREEVSVKDTTDYAAYIAYAPPGGYKNYPEYTNYGKYDRDLSPEAAEAVSEAIPRALN
jgi:hypothetical protein